MSAGIEDAEATRMLRFALLWAPFGGCDEDIFPAFGVSTRTFYTRILHILAGESALSSTPAGQTLAELCVRKTSSRQGASV